jgi:hypothetical protein
MKWDFFSNKKLILNYKDFSIILNSDFSKSSKFHFVNEYENDFLQEILNTIINV